MCSENVSTGRYTINLSRPTCIYLREMWHCQCLAYIGQCHSIAYNAYVTTDRGDNKKLRSPNSSVITSDRSHHLRLAKARERHMKCDGNEWNCAVREQCDSVNRTNNRVQATRNGKRKTQQKNCHVQYSYYISIEQNGCMNVAFPT